MTIEPEDSAECHIEIALNGTDFLNNNVTGMAILAYYSTDDGWNCYIERQ